MNHELFPGRLGCLARGCGRFLPALRSAGRLVLLLGGSLVLGTFGAGCGKTESGAAQAEVMRELETQPAKPAPVAPAALPAPTAPAVNLSANANPDAVVQQLNRELLKWMVQNRRAPATFEEFVASAKISVPPPPAGKKYVIGGDRKIVLR